MDFVRKGEDFPFCGFPEPWFDRNTKSRYLGFEIFFGHQLPEEEDEQTDLSTSTGQGRTASLGIDEEELLGKALADLLTSSNAGIEPINLRDNFTISMIGDKPATDFTGLIVDTSEASRLVWMLRRAPLATLNQIMSPNLIPLSLWS